MACKRIIVSVEVTPHTDEQELRKRVIQHFQAITNRNREDDGITHVNMVIVEDSPNFV